MRRSEKTDLRKASCTAPRIRGDNKFAESGGRLDGWMGLLGGRGGGSWAVGGRPKGRERTTTVPWLLPASHATDRLCMVPPAAELRSARSTSGRAGRAPEPHRTPNPLAPAGPRTPPPLHATRIRTRRRVAPATTATDPIDPNIPCAPGCQSGVGSSLGHPYPTPARPPTA